MVLRMIPKTTEPLGVTMWSHDNPDEGSAWDHGYLSEVAQDVTFQEPQEPELTQVMAGKAPGAMMEAGKSLDEEVCTICGDRASGYHYNALSCEGCKGFFRRSVTRGAKYQCKFGGNCEMDMWMRRKCQACRFRCCKEVGMKEECLLSDEQCRARDVRRKIKLQRKNSMAVDQETMSSTSNVSNTSSTSTTSEVVMVSATSMSEEMEAVVPGYNSEPMSHLTEAHREIIYRLLRYQDMFELPREEDIQQVTVSTAKHH